MALRVPASAVARKAAPFIWIPMFLWLLQVWSIWDSEFTMEVTMLQLPFVMVFEILIVIIAYHRLVEDLDAGEGLSVE